MVTCAAPGCNSSKKDTHTYFTNTVTATIDKLKMWTAGEWKTYNTIQTTETNIFLRIHFDQLFILTENKVLETLNLNGKIKGIYKDDVLILITCNAPQQVRKIKFRIKSNLIECFHKLSLHFPVMSFNNTTNFQHQVKYKNIEEVLRNAINDQGSVAHPPLQPNFKDFVKLCLLDPSFPNVVVEAQDIIKKMMFE